MAKFTIGIDGISIAKFIVPKRIKIFLFNLFVKQDALVFVKDHLALAVNTSV